MRKILLTGMSGVGKSTVLEKLASEGIPCVDLDDGWMQEINGERLINLQAVQQFIDTLDSERIVLAGCAMNQGQLDAEITILLTASPETMKTRIAGRKNPFGKDEETWRKIVTDKIEIEPILQAKSNLVIHTEQALDDTVRQIMQLLERDSG